MNDRDEILQLIKKGEYNQAALRLDQYITSHSTIDSQIFAVRTYQTLAKHLKLPKLKIALLRSITLEPTVPFIEWKCFFHKIHPEIYLGGYNLIDQEILDDKSQLYQFQPDVLIIFSRIQELAPKLLDEYPQLTKKQTETEGQNIIKKFDGLINTVRAKSKAKIIIHNFELPAYPTFGIVDKQYGKSQKRVFEKINNELLTLAEKHDDVYILDYDQLISRHGKKNWHDEKLWYTSKAPLSRIGLEALADEYIRYFIPMCGLTKKCIVLDLDNTLWGGILGEDGVNGIQLGETSPGNAYKDFQKELLKLYNKGFILAINSKNNESDVLEAFEKHPSMVLKKEHFSTMKINWNPKTQNMKEIAKDLNIDMNTFVFIDDNPIERELIRQQLPQIQVVDIPDNPHMYPQILQNLPFFEMLSISEEDTKRGRMYYEQTQRKKLQESSTSIEDFYRSLEMTAIIQKNDKNSIPRLTKMTQKTNQFNLTTIRYADTDIHKFMDSQDSDIYSLRLIDKFGDNGIVGEIIVKQDNQTWYLDTFLLSCRVIGRTVETAFLSYLLNQAKKQNVKSIVGKYLPTQKNIVVKDLYEQHNFNLIEEKDGSSTWKIDVEQSTINTPEWIEIKEK